jgi:exopolysaccharide biosynthesis predicted pyruvyltransferase EpsI
MLKTLPFDVSNQRSNKWRVVDERGTEHAQQYPNYVAARPFAIQTFERNKWITVPGAYYTTRKNAEAAAKFLCTNQ